ncbi:MAG TPA: glycogen debranching enzyme N-terminal domain-containing protein, partial [Spirochaetia bacterium]|nr:glycogen debranching enzyme N-terminal domain-containing protein [Spirochaetia bacterium]
MGLLPGSALSVPLLSGAVRPEGPKAVDSLAEWLETDGLGGYASGTVSGVRTRRYHALLLSAVNPPTGRLVLVNGFDATVETPDGIQALSSQYYEPGVLSPDGAERIES